MLSADEKQQTESSDAVKIQLRAPKVVRDKIDEAAALLHISRTEFMLKAASTAAEDALLDRRLFALEEDQFHAFEAALAAPLPETANLENLLAKKPAWER
ncbi:DUF1778 domain-containing protein [Hyphococcus formosus]